VSLILVVEDDEEVRKVIAETVGQLGHEVRLARSAAEALVATRAERPDAILLDIALPDSNETATLDRLRTVRPDVPIIVVTANADLDVARATLHHGAFDYIMKPFEAPHLASVLQAALAASRS
jgi:CheY-like chemotaxis protein